MHLKVQKIDRRMHFMRIFAFFQILQILMILEGFQPQISIASVISCLRLVPDRPGMESQFFSNLSFLTCQNSDPPMYRTTSNILPFDMGPR